MVSFATLVGYAIVACMMLDSAFGTDGVFWFMAAELSVVGTKFLMSWRRHYVSIYSELRLAAHIADEGY